MKLLPTPAGPTSRTCLVLVQELQGEDGIRQPAVERDRRRPVEVLQAADLLEAGGLQAHLDAAVGPAECTGPTSPAPARTDMPRATSPTVRAMGPTWMARSRVWG